MYVSPLVGKNLETKKIDITIKKHNMVTQKVEVGKSSLAEHACSEHHNKDQTQFRFFLMFITPFRLKAISHEPWIQNIVGSERRWKIICGQQNS